VLVLIGAAVLAARTFGRQDATDTRPTSVPTSVPTRVAPAAAVAPTPPVAEARRTQALPPTPSRAEAQTPTLARARAVPTATAARAAVGAPTVAPTVRTTAGAPTLAPAARTVEASGTAAHTSSATEATGTPTTVRAPTVVPEEVSSPTAVEARTATGAVALTFDAGADRGYAEDILDRLAEDHAIGSFGITGNWAKANPDLVRRMAADGHLVFNHTLDHRSFTGLSDSLGGLSATARRTELERADAIIAPLIGHTTEPFYRLPYGDDDAHVAADVAPDGYTRKIGWTVDSEGWRGLLAQDILARCLKLAAPGAVYVFHVGRASRDAQALPQIIAGLRERGYTFARVDQI
jgi:peptidoglycan/xylan/chitin deacetylase (PgdA/CDA1 family)